MLSTELVPDHEVHVYHHSYPLPARVSLKVERNSKSVNVEVSISNAGSPDEAVALYLETINKLKEHLPAA